MQWYIFIRGIKWWDLNHIDTWNAYNPSQRHGTWYDFWFEAQKRRRRNPAQSVRAIRKNIVASALDEYYCIYERMLCSAGT